MQNGRLAGINAALSSAFFLGLAPVFGKAAMGGDHFSPFAVVALRTGAAAFLLFVIMAVFNRKFLYIYGTGLLGCIIAGSINGIGSLFYYVGLSKLNASIAQMLYALYPFFVAIWLILERQPLSRLTLVRIAIAFIAAILLTQSGADSIDPIGVACMIIAAGFYAAHIPINQRVLYDVPAPTVTLYTLISMSVIVISAYFLFDRGLPNGKAPWLPVFALTMVTFFSRLTLFLGIKHIGGMQTALLGLGELIVAILFSHILLNETLTRIQWVGVACLGSSLLLVLLEKPAPHPPTHAHGLLSWLQPPDFPDDFYKH